MANDRSGGGGAYLGWFLLGATLGGLAGLLLAALILPAFAQDAVPPKKEDPKKPAPPDPDDFRRFFKKPETVVEYWERIANVRSALVTKPSPLTSVSSPLPLWPSAAVILAISVSSTTPSPLTSPSRR